jgi:chemotaxis signal transduction protein
MGEAAPPSIDDADTPAVDPDAPTAAHPGGAEVDELEDEVDELVDEIDELVDDRPRFVRFALGDHELLVDVTEVGEVLVAGPVTRLPGAADAIVGVTSVRGRIVAVVDVSGALGAPTPSRRERFLVVATADGPVAIVVDRVDAVVPADVDPVPHLAPEADGASPPSPLVTATAMIDGRRIPIIDAPAAIGAAIDPASATDDEPSGSTVVGSVAGAS